MIQVARAGGEAIGFHAQLLQDGDIKIAERPPITAIALEPVMLPGLESATREQNWQVTAGMRAGVTHAATEQDNCGVQERFAIHVPGFLHAIQKTCQLLCIVELNDRELPEKIRPFSVVGQRMITKLNSLEREQAVPARMPEGYDIRGPGLQGQHHEVIHHRRIVGIVQVHHDLVVTPDDFITGLWLRHIKPPCLTLQFEFHLPHRGQVFVQLGLVVRGYPCAESLGVRMHHIQDAGILIKELPLAGLALCIVLEKQSGEHPGRTPVGRQDYPAS